MLGILPGGCTEKSKLHVSGNENARAANTSVYFEGRDKNVADINKNMDSEKESGNLQAIDTAARMDCKQLPGAIAWQLIRLVPPI